VNLEALEQSIDDLAASGDELIDVFSYRLSVRAPELVPLFILADPKWLKAMLVGGLAPLRQSSTTFDSSMPEFRALGARLHEHRVEPKHYAIVGEVLIASMADVLGEAWLPEFEEAWCDVFVVVACAMIDGAYEGLLPAAA
jgi:nitric oxide dioxygenase